MISLDSLRCSDLKVLQKKQDRIVVAAFCGTNRTHQVARYQQRVFDQFAIPINQVLVDFSRFYHGTAIDAFLKKIELAYDYFLLFDSDAVPLRSEFVDTAHEKIRDGRTLFGVAQQSNHIFVNNTKNHLYAGPAALAISRRLYVRLGRPSFAHTNRSDTAEELTWRAEELGYTVALMFPSHVHQRLWDLGNGHSFGLGTTYSDWVFHAFLQGKRESRTLFVNTCRAVLSGRRRRRF